MPVPRIMIAINCTQHKINHFVVADRMVVLDTISERSAISYGKPLHMYHFKHVVTRCIIQVVFVAVVAILNTEVYADRILPLCSY